MALKIIVFATLLALARAGLLSYTSPHHAVDAVASTHESVVRSFDGTVSTHSKAVHTPYSSVHKQDTRVSNNVYRPALAKTVTYANAAPTDLYAHGTPVHEAAYAAAPVYNHHAHPQAVASYAAPAVTHVYQHEVPSTVPTHYQHGPAASTYTHNTPSVSAYGSSQTVHYSPANMVSHMSFDGFGTHWGF